MRSQMTSTDARMSDSNPGAISSLSRRWTCSSVRTSCHTLRPSLANLVIASLSPTSTDWPSAAVITSLPSAPVVNVTCPDISRAAAAAAVAESWSTPASVARLYASASMASASASFLFCSACCCWSVLSTSLSRWVTRRTVPWIPSSAPLSPAWDRSCVHTSLATSLPFSTSARLSRSVLSRPWSLVAAPRKVPATFPVPLLARLSTTLNTRLDTLRAFSMRSSDSIVFSRNIFVLSLMAWTF
mmetsp:Transcript_7250/g.30015  ORF Transcript_7250/g.30015 Transcript_7250/m.30015 type:complete len:243 (-) Transcript_7250:280-1008(-)